LPSAEVEPNATPFTGVYRRSLLLLPRGSSVDDHQPGIAERGDPVGGNCSRRSYLMIIFVFIIASASWRVCTRMLACPTRARSFS